MCSSIQFRGANTSKMVQKFGHQQYKYHLRDLLQQKTKGHFEKCWPTACLGRMLYGSEGRNGNCATATSNKMQQVTTHLMEQKPNKTCCRWLHQLPKPSLAPCSPHVPHPTNSVRHPGSGVRSGRPPTKTFRPLRTAWQVSKVHLDLQFVHQFLEGPFPNFPKVYVFTVRLSEDVTGLPISHRCVLGFK